MKKSLIALLLLLFSLQFLSGQDKIITIEQDTILCRIVAISPAYIHYEQKGENQQVIGKFIPTEQVLEFLRTTPSSETNPYLWIGDRQKIKPARPWLIGIQLGGASILTSSANDERAMINMNIPKSQASDYCKQLKQGWSFSGDIHYLLSNLFGVGARYSFFVSSAQQDFAIKANDYYPEYMYLNIKEKQMIHYVGPSVIFQQWLDKNHKFQLNETLSAGYVHYRDEVRMMFPYPNLLVEGNTWGANVGLSAEYYPVSYLSVGLNADLIYAKLTKLDYSTKEETQTVNLNKNDQLNLLRLDYSLSIRFHF
ncbi:MAG: hypothetical protein FWF52_03525 [Candidatus Azobacteroides sp.]|nr:hypothetical protein [Candidatus Azobacteroides sp.]